MGTLLVGTLGVALHTLARPAPSVRAHPPLSVNDTIAWRAAIQHGRALVRNEQAEQACRAERETQYARFDRIYIRHRVASPFLTAQLGYPLPPPDTEVIENDISLDVVGEGRVESIRIRLSSGSSRWWCHSAGDEAIDCPPVCDAEPMDACEVMHRRLDRDWWPEARAIWRSRMDEVRASLDGSHGECELVYEYHVDKQRWIGTKPTAEIPIGLVGKPSSYLRMHGRWGVGREWRSAATGDYITPMSVSVITKHGLITEVRAVGPQSDEGSEEILEMTKDLPVTVTNTTDGQILIVARAN